jgi:PAS domain S-box-containing protein
MKVSRYPENEKQRLEAIHRFQILDSEEDPDFDGIVEIASQICNSAIAVITLVDERRQWFKARVGLSVRETDRDFSFCAHAIHYDDIMIVEDALSDERFNDNPLVTGEPFIRFYAGIPLISNDNYKVGTLAVIDPIPRTLSEMQKSCLRNLAKQVVNLLNMRLNILELRKSNVEISYLANIVEQTNDAIISIDQLGLIRSWNRGAEILYGFRRDDTIGRSIHDIVRGSIIPFDDNFENFVYSDKVWRGEVKHLHREGTPIFLLLTVSPLPTNDRKRVGYVLQLRDISDRKKLEDELNHLHEEAIRLANERYRNIFENSLHGIFQTTIEGRFITVNKAMAHMFGYDSPEDLIREVTDIAGQLYIDPHDRQHIRKVLASEGKLTGYEFKAIKKNRQIIWVRAHIQVLHDKAGMSYFEGMVEDVTERRISDEKLNNQFDELKKINYELDRFVYSVSHDLRAPLSSILGITNIAEMESPSDTQRQYLYMIRDSIQRLDEFIKAILTYSRNTRMDVQLEQINFAEIIESMQKNLRSMNGSTRLKLTYSIHGEETFYSDSLRIGIILNNLYSNAIKYQDYQKDHSFCNINVNVLTDSAEITVVDNGIGIPPDLLDKVFDMFYRAHDISKGSGLGLYIARETVMKLRGSIAVDSVFKEHATFKVVLPNLLKFF